MCNLCVMSLGLAYRGLGRLASPCGRANAMSSVSRLLMASFLPLPNPRRLGPGAQELWLAMLFPLMTLPRMTAFLLV